MKARANAVVSLNLKDLNTLATMKHAEIVRLQKSVKLKVQTVTEPDARERNK